MFEIIIKFIKFIFLLSIFYYLYNNNYFDFSLLNSLINNIPLNITLIFLTTLTVIIGGYRWYLILNSFNVNITLKKTLKIHYIAFFFNNVLFGSIGGDVLKIHYVIKHSKNNKLRNNITILIDRIFGLMGLFFLGIISSLIVLIEIGEYKLFHYSILFLIFSIFIFLIIIQLIKKKNYYLKIKVFLLKTYKNFFVAFILSIILFFIVHYSTFIISRFIFNFDISLLQIFFSNFISTIVSALPLTPGGIGLAEISFAFTNKYFFNILLNNLANVIIYLRIVDFIVSLPSLYFYMFYKNK